MNFLYPEGKKSALTFSYDDNRNFDRKLVEIFNKYGMKATFNVNSGTLGVQPSENNDGNEYIMPDELTSLYKGHEIASHGYNHKYISGLTDSEIIREFTEDRIFLEQYTALPVRGMAYAYGNYDERIISVLKKLGFIFGRTVNSTNGFFPPADFMQWHPTCHQCADNLLELGKSFLNPPSYIELPLMYVWGHSFENGLSGDWDTIEEFCKLMSGKDYIWYAANIEICEYILATRLLVFSADGRKVYNPSLIKIWAVRNNGEVFTINPGEYVDVE